MMLDSALTFQCGFLYCHAYAAPALCKHGRTLHSKRIRINPSLAILILQYTKVTKVQFALFHNQSKFLKLLCNVYKLADVGGFSSP